MINIASSQPVHWPVSPTAVAIAPVSAVTAVSPTERSQRDGQSGSGLGSGRQAQAQASSGTGQKKEPTQEASSGASQAAPILPIDNPKDGQALSATQSQDQANQQAGDAQATEEDRSAQTPKLIDVLSSVWQASAAVVDNVLGRGKDSVDGVVAGQSTQQTTSSTPAQGEPTLDSPVFREDGGVQAGSEPPVAYTEQGASEWGGLEMGRLVSKKA